MLGFMRGSVHGRSKELEQQQHADRHICQGPSDRHETPPKHRVRSAKTIEEGRQGVKPGRPTASWYVRGITARHVALHD
jgi:hypothetical protein